VFLFRAAGIRDHCLHLVNDVYELGLRPFDVRVSKVVKALPREQEEVRDAVMQMASCASSHRDERNRRAHEGTQREVIAEPIFQLLAMEEERDDPTSGRSRVTSSGAERVYDVREVVLEAARKLEDEFLPAAEQLVTATTDLVEALAGPFLERAGQKRFDRR